MSAGSGQPPPVVGIAQIRRSACTAGRLGRVRLPLPGGGEARGLSRRSCASRPIHKPARGRPRTSASTRCAACWCQRRRGSSKQTADSTTTARFRRLRKPRAGFPLGDEPAVSPATKRRLVAFQLGNDVVGVVDACSRARATVRVLAGGPRQGALSKRIGRAERVARLHNLSADVLIANVAAPVRTQQSGRCRRDCCSCACYSGVLG
jgi:hypothetical protein